MGKGQKALRKTKRMRGGIFGLEKCVGSLCGSTQGVVVPGGRPPSVAAPTPPVSPIEPPTYKNVELHASTRNILPPAPPPMSINLLNGIYTTKSGNQLPFLIFETNKKLFVSLNKRFTVIGYSASLAGLNLKSSNFEQGHTFEILQEEYADFKDQMDRNNYVEGWKVKNNKDEVTVLPGIWTAEREKIRIKDIPIPLVVPKGTTLIALIRKNIEEQVKDTNTLLVAYDREKKSWIFYKTEWEKVPEEKSESQIGNFYVTEANSLGNIINPTKIQMDWRQVLMDENNVVFYKVILPKSSSGGKRTHKKRKSKRKTHRRRR
jgi:hypothetical protein